MAWCPSATRPLAGHATTRKFRAEARREGLVHGVASVVSPEAVPNEGPFPSPAAQVHHRAKGMRKAIVGHRMLSDGSVEPRLAKAFPAGFVLPGRNEWPDPSLRPLSTTYLTYRPIFDHPWTKRASRKRNQRTVGSRNGPFRLYDGIGEISLCGGGMEWVDRVQTAPPDTGATGEVAAVEIPAVVIRHQLDSRLIQGAAQTAWRRAKPPHLAAAAFQPSP